MKPNWPFKDQTDSIQSSLFLVESSGRRTLNARQACAVESAALQSGMEVILVVKATQLDLKDNTTCYLFMKKNTVKIYSIDVEAFSLNSPLGKWAGESERHCLNKNKC